MDIETFLTKKEQIEKKSIEEQKAFYKNLMETEKAYSFVQLQSAFQYAMLFYHRYSGTYLLFSSYGRSLPL